MDKQSISISRASVRRKKTHHTSDETQSSLSSPLSAQQTRVLQLQRTIGNRAAQTLLQRETEEDDEPEPPYQDQIEEALLLYNISHFDAAIDSLQQVLVQYPQIDGKHRADVLYNIAQCYREQGRYVKAQEYYEKTLKTPGISSEAIASAKERLATVKEKEGEDSPQDVEIRYALKLYKRGNLSEAIVVLQDVLQKYKDLPGDERANVLYNIGQCYYFARRYEKAAEAYRAAIATADADPGAVAASQRKLRKITRKTANKEPHHFEVKYALKLYKSNQFYDAIEALNGVLKKYTNLAGDERATVLFNIGQCHFYNKDYAQAISFYHQVANTPGVEAESAQEAQRKLTEAHAEMSGKKKPAVTAPMPKKHKKTKKVQQPYIF